MSDFNDKGLLGLIFLLTNILLFAFVVSLKLFFLKLFISLMNLSQNNFLKLLSALEYNGFLPYLSSIMRKIGTK